MPVSHAKQRAQSEGLHNRDKDWSTVKSLKGSGLLKRRRHVLAVRPWAAALQRYTRHDGHHGTATWQEQQSGEYAKLIHCKLHTV